MIRFFLLRVLALLLIGYSAYYVIMLIAVRKKKKTPPDIKKLESTDYDKNEWEKIKKELDS